MLNAIAREVGHAADAVTSAAGAAVEAVLPGKSSRDDAPTEDEDVHRKGSDQEQGKQQDKQSKKDQAKTPEFKPSDQLEQPEEAAPAQAQEEPSVDMSIGKEDTSKKQQQQQQQQQQETHDDAEDVAAAAATSEPQGRPSEPSKTINTDITATGSAARAGLKGQAHQQLQQQLQQARLAQQQQQTAGAAPLPKYSKGHAKWMKSSTAWYPDRSGIQHPPGVFINRRTTIRI